jgi:hypothetical protein
MAKIFRDWNVNQSLMFPPSVRDFVPEGHLAHLVRDTVVEHLDLSEFRSNSVNSGDSLPISRKPSVPSHGFKRRVRPQEQGTHYGQDREGRSTRLPPSRRPARQSPSKDLLLRS